MNTDAMTSELEYLPCGILNRNRGLSLRFGINSKELSRYCPCRLNRELLCNADPEALQRGHAFRMVGEQPNLMDIEVGENLRAHSNISLRSSLVGGSAVFAHFTVKHETIGIVHVEAL